MRTSKHTQNSNLILVLNSDYLPVNVTSFKRAFKLVYKGKAEIVESEGEIFTSTKKFAKPSVIRLIKYVSIPYRKVVLSRDNIFRRDEHRCAYCNTNKDLTIDHIYPKSRGGKNSWENLITCCFKCNSKKGDKTPEEAKMELLYKPTKPGSVYFMYRSYKKIEKWQPYIFN